MQRQRERCVGAASVAREGAAQKALGSSSGAHRFLACMRGCRRLAPGQPPVAVQLICVLLAHARQGPNYLWGCLRAERRPQIATKHLKVLLNSDTAELRGHSCPCSTPH